MTPETEFETFEKQKSWAAIFQRVHATAQKEHNYSFKDARRPEFRNRNRYGDVSPYDHSRIHLIRNDIDYINASLVESPDADRAYILTQGPLPDTAGHFWLMVWEQDSRAIVMLNSIIEKGHVKCHQYYPLGEDNEDEDELEFKDVGLKVKLLSESTEPNYYYTARHYQVHDLESNKKKKVTQFHFTAWLDFAVPDSNAFLDFLFAVRDSGALKDPSRPPVVHCSAGIGRSGTFCLVDTCLVLIENQKSMENIKVLDILLELRKFRMGLIQTSHQLRFSYQAIIKGAKRVLRNENSNNNSEGSEEEMDTEIVSSVDARSNDRDHDSDSPPDTPPPVPPRKGDATSGSQFPDASSNSSRSDDLSANNSGNTNVQDGLSSILNGTANGGVDDGYATSGGGVKAANGAVSTESEQDNNQATHDLRRRKREERIKNTSDQIAKMKQRQRDSELWHSREQRFKPYVVGLLAVVAVGGYALYRYYWT